MSVAELIPILIFVTIALSASVFLVFGFAGGIHIEPYFRRLASAWLPAILLFGFGASTLISGRNASLYGLTNNILADGDMGRGTWMLRIATALAVGASTFVVASRFLRKAAPQNAAKLLFISFSAYFFSTYIISGILGTAIFISHKSLYPFLVIFALYITADHDETLLLKLVRNALFIFLVTGLILIPLLPDLVTQKGYHGIIPGLKFRYWGLASHANNIGPLAIFFFLVTCWVPYKSRSMMALAIIVAAITLVISQSKTAYISALVVLFMFSTRLWLLAIFKNKFGLFGGVVAIGIPMLIALMTLVFFISDISIRPLEQFVDRLQGRGTLFTGRENIWWITLAEWGKNPFFGYGPGLWGEEFSARYGYTGIASNAHNQFFDTLGSAGIFGEIFLVFYCLVLIRYSIILAEKSNWISIAMVLFVATRCISEVPLKTMNITTSDFFMHAVIVGLFMRAATKQAKNSLGHTQQASPKY